MGFAVGGGRQAGKGPPPFRASAENESELLDCDDAIFLTSSDAAASAPLHMNEFFLEVMDYKNKF